MSDHDALDDIENRAALLMAQREAMRRRQNPSPVDDDGRTAHDETVDDASPDSVDGPDDRLGPIALDAPVPAETSREDAKPDGRPIPDPVASPPQHDVPTVPFVDERSQDDGDLPLTGPDAAGSEPANGRHRMALPPWQTAPPPIRGDMTSAEEDVTISGPADDVDDRGAADATAVHPALPAQMPTPNGSWPPPTPPPGWAPAMAPPVPPPGWPGMPPPWMPPPPHDGHLRPPSEDHRQTHTVTHAPASPSTAFPQQDGTPTFQSPPSLDEMHVLTPRRNAPSHGWRRWVYRITGGRIDPGPTPREQDEQQLVSKIQRPIVGDYKIAVLSIKGGVGKTATTLGLGSALATVRTDRVIAVDANPDRGTLAERVADTSTFSTVRDLLRDPDIHRYADVRNHTRMAATSRLEVLASEQDPAVAEVFGEEDYCHTIEILRQYYNVILTDCGTGIIHSAMAGVLDLADVIVLVSSPAIDAARSASATLDWLVEHGYGSLVRDAHVVFSASRPGSEKLKLEKVSEHFEARCGSVHVIPFDPHLAEGAEFDFNVLRPATTRAYLRLAARVSDDFSRRR